MCKSEREREKNRKIFVCERVKERERDLIKLWGDSTQNAALKKEK